MRPAGWALRRRSRGASLVEYLVLISVVAVGGAAGWHGLGRAFGAGVREQARCLDGMTSEGCTADGAAPPAHDAPAIGPTQKQPELGDFPSAGFAHYRRAAGIAFVHGPGDAHPVDPSDVKQGPNTKDCYLMASLMAIAGARPAFVQRAVVATGNGSYEVVLHLERKRAWYARWMSPKLDARRVQVSPDFPSSSFYDYDGTRAPAWMFAQTGDRADGVGADEIWPMLVEKAYVAVRGSYGALGSGHAAIALQHLTGHPSTCTCPAEMRFEDLAAAVESKHAVVAGTHPDVRHELFQNGTLVQQHAYVVAAVDRAARTVTLQNPWGWDAKAPVTIPFAAFQATFRHVDVNPIE